MGILWSRLKWKDKNKKVNFPEKLPWNIYGDTSKTQHIKRFHKIHYWLKYRLILPFLWFANIITRNIKPRWDKPFDRNFKVFEKAFDEAIYKWTQYLTLHKIEPKNKLTGLEQSMVEDQLNGISQRIIKQMKDILMKVCYYDTAYRELFNIMVFELTKAMIQEYKREKIYHILYTSKNIFDVQYKNAWDILAECETDEIRKGNNKKG